jgi:hypothetical protein
MLHINESDLEIAENTKPVAVAVHEVIHADGRKSILYVGNQIAACDPDTLLDLNITSTMNVSLNIVIPALQLADGIHVRRANIGLIDGTGNPASYLASAVLALHGLLTQDSPGKAYYPAHRYGNVMVNCRGGRSRSVTVLALYMHLTAPEQWPTLQSAINHIRELRGNATHYPLEPMIAMAERLIEHGALAKLLEI